MEVLNLDFLNDSNMCYTELDSLLNEIYMFFKTDMSKEKREAAICCFLCNEEFSITLNNFFVSLILCVSRIPLKSEVYPSSYTITKKDFILHSVTSPNKEVKKYFDETINVFSEVVGLPITVITKRISYSIELLAKYMWNINYHKGNTVNIYDVIKLMQEIPEVREILNYTVDESQHLQFAEIEDSISKKTKRLIEIIKNDSGDNYLNAMVDSISLGQFQQTFVNVGLKPDLYENVIPRPINTSILRGFRDSTDFFINATGARKALITNAKLLALHTVMCVEKAL